MQPARFYGRSAAVRAARDEGNRALVAMHANPVTLLKALLSQVMPILARPKVLAFASLMLFAAFGAAHGAAAAAPLVAGTFVAKRTFPINPLPVDGGTSTHTLTPGQLEEGVLISVLYSANVTAVGTAVRTYSMPVRRISLVAGSTTLQQWRASDLIRIAQIFEQTPIGALLVPASGVAIANYTNLEAHIPLMFRQPGRGDKNDATSIPTWAYKKGVNDLQLVIEWGSVTDLLTGAPTGAVTFTARGATVTQLDYADVAIPGNDSMAFARQFPVNLSSYKELVQLAVANTEAEIDIGTLVNIRALMIVTELTSTGEPTNTLVNKITLKEDNSLNVHENLPWASIRADNAKHFGLTLPTGVAILDFAEDGDIFKIYRAQQKQSVKMILDTAAVAGTVRVAKIGIGNPVRV